MKKLLALSVALIMASCSVQKTIETASSGSYGKLQLTANADNLYIQQLANGDIQFHVSYPGYAQQSYVECFVKINGVQVRAADITSNFINNGRGTWSYYYTMPASAFKAGDNVETRFYSVVSGAGTFTPGPAEQVWSPVYTVGTATSSAASSAVSSSVASSSASSVDPMENGMIWKSQYGFVTISVAFAEKKDNVMLFIKKNGEQVKALDITGSEYATATGKYQYGLAWVDGNLAVNDRIEYRFYSAKNGAQTFTPGPGDSVWSTPFYYF